MNNPINNLYVHGYLGSGNGQSSKLVRGEFQAHGIPVKLNAPQFPVTEPRTMHEKLNQLLENNTYDFVVASSLGAIYVMQIPGVKKILVNIAVPDNLRRIRKEDPDNNNQYLTDSFLNYLEDEKNFFKDF